MIAPNLLASLLLDVASMQVTLQTTGSVHEGDGTINGHQTEFQMQWHYILACDNTYSEKKYLQSAG